MKIEKQENSPEKFSGAMKIFQALSAVDEELLERSEKKKNFIPFWSYSRVVAACLCLVIMGASIYAGKMIWMPKDQADKATRLEVEEIDLEEDSNTQMAAAADFAESAADAGGAGDTAYFHKQSDAQTDDLNQESEVLEECYRPRYEGIAVTEEEARTIEGLGEYIPTNLPDGYVFESAHKIEDEAAGVEQVRILWRKGMDDISISVSRCDTKSVEEMTLIDVSRPETYDERLYEIPYGETVPEEFREMFQHPVFAEKDFSKEVVSARMKSFADSGDTSTPRGKFSVLYSTGALVEFNGNGSTDAIWSMFQSINH